MKKNSEFGKILAHIDQNKPQREFVFLFCSSVIVKVVNLFQMVLDDLSFTEAMYFLIHDFNGKLFLKAKTENHIWLVNGSLDFDTNNLQNFDNLALD